MFSAGDLQVTVLLAGAAVVWAAGLYCLIYASFIPMFLTIWANGQHALDGMFD